MRDQNNASELIHKALEDFVISCTEIFILLEFYALLCFLNLNLNCKHITSQLLEANALTNSVMIQVSVLKHDLNSELKNQTSKLQLGVNGWTPGN